MVKARLYILAAAALWSTAGVAIKLCALGPWQVAAGRSLVCAAFLFLALREARRRPTPGILAVGAAYAATVLLFVWANKATTAANTIFLQSTAPLFVLVFSPLVLGERPTPRELAAVPVFLLGVGLFSLDKLSPGQAAGNVVAVVSGVAFALTMVGLRRLGPAGMAAIAWGNVVAVVVGAPLALSGPPPAASELGWILYLGVFQLGCAYLCFQRGIRRLPAIEASLLTLLEPVLNPFWTFLFVGERPGAWALCGGAVILGATVWRTLLQPTSAPPARPAPGRRPA